MNINIAAAFMVFMVGDKKQPLDVFHSDKNHTGKNPKANIAHKTIHFLLSHI